MKHIYKPKGVCAKQITVELNDDGVIESVDFLGGCPGNLLGLSGLVKGMTAEEVITKCKGIPCGARTTSCPDQLSLALEEIKNK